MPNKKGEKLARYHEINWRGYLPEPQLLEQQIPPFLPLPGSELDHNCTSKENCDADPCDEYDTGEAFLFAIVYIGGVIEVVKHKECICEA